MQQKGKLIYIEGIRGMAALMVVLHHYLLSFYPAQANGNSSVAHLKTIELWYYKSPFIFLTNGQLYVYIFFILSGFVLSRKFFLEKDMTYLVSAAIKRFPRLYMPVAFSLVVTFILLKFYSITMLKAAQLTKSAWFASLQGDPSVIAFLKSLFFKVMFASDNSYNIVLWTITRELYGSFLVFVVLAGLVAIQNTSFGYLLFCWYSYL